jgi:DNA-directed RNA polymerase subunit L
MALINLGSGNEQLRVAAYNMLHSLSTNFQFSIRLHEAEGLCIPSNSFNFIVDLSEQLAATQINLTLEFLLECLQGLSTSKVSCYSDI